MVGAAEKRRVSPRRRRTERGRARRTAVRRRQRTVRLRFRLDLEVEARNEGDVSVTIPSRHRDFRSSREKFQRTPIPEVVDRDVERKREVLPHIVLVLVRVLVLALPFPLPALSLRPIGPHRLHRRQRAVELRVERAELVGKVVTPEQLVEEEGGEARLYEDSLVERLSEHATEEAKAVEVVLRNEP